MCLRSRSDQTARTHDSCELGYRRDKGTHCTAGRNSRETSARKVRCLSRSKTAGAGARIILKDPVLPEPLAPGASADLEQDGDRHNRRATKPADAVMATAVSKPEIIELVNRLRTAFAQIRNQMRKKLASAPSLVLGSLFAHTVQCLSCNSNPLFRPVRLA